MILQYGLLLETNGRGDMDGSLTFDTAEDALNSAYALFQSGHNSISLFSVDIKSGEIKQVMDRREITNRRYRYEEAERSEEAGEARHGSYFDQFALRTADIIGRA